MALKMHGVLSTAQLGKLLGTTGEAARQQLVKLSEEGLVSATTEGGRVGRPTQNWSLAPAAYSRFPDTHAALTVQLLDILRSTMGQSAVDKLIDAREAMTLKAYSSLTDHRPDLSGKLAALAEARSAEGYMAEYRQQEDGSYLFIENHCPICAAATACQGFCRAELDVFKAAIGPGAEVQRIEHIVHGGRRCSYSVREAH
jgi:predicted ArsR family transcriptional regulator